MEHYPLASKGIFQGLSTSQGLGGSALDAALLGFYVVNHRDILGGRISIWSSHSIGVHSIYGNRVPLHFSSYLIFIGPSSSLLFMVLVSQAPWKVDGLEDTMLN